MDTDKINAPQAFSCNCDGDCEPTSLLSAEQQIAGREAELTAEQELALRQRMRYLLDEDSAAYQDSGGEWNTTRLAEDAAEDLRLTGEDADATIPERVFELALQITDG